MRFTCEKGQLLAAAKLANQVRGGTKVSFPVLECLHLQVGDDGFVMRMTDLTTQVTQSLIAESAEPGKALLPVKWLLEVLPFLEDKVSVEAKDNLVKVKSGKAVFELVSLADDYPVPLSEKPDVSVKTMDADDFYNAFRQTLPTVSYDETRYFLCGVYLDVIKAGMNIVATDGRCMAVKGLSFKWDKLRGKSAILPTKAAKIMRGLAKDAERVHLKVGDSYVSANFHGVEVATTPTEGAYPDYVKLIPKYVPPPGGELRVDRLSLYRAVNRMNTMADETTHRLRFQLEKNPSILSHSERGKATEKLDGTYLGEDMKIGINGTYVVKAMRAFKADQVIVKFHSELRPWLIKSDSDNLTYVIMPMRLDDFGG